MPPTSEAAEFSRRLLTTALGLSPDSSLENLVAFLDSTSCLRSLKMPDIDLASETAVCFFVNVYHSLLQHALLLLGPPTKSSVTHFMRCVCYEIGNDVFSLAELEYCVIRGRLSAPQSSRSFFVEPSKSSADAFRFYALGAVDARVNFVLHTGLKSNPVGVHVLDHRTPLGGQLNEASTAHVQASIMVDSKKRVVHLPEIYKAYRGDFGGNDPLKFLLRFLEKKEWEAVSWLIAEPGGVAIKYSHTHGDFQTFLAPAEGRGSG
ncbi:hypothetical protein TeGR_g3289 [Tetraparma gracilis]|uniref:DUF547 domain-containing protein n=1 Tax=Tetraparma gracilis TaxID=2962635 RepID=A0ABQ6N5R7_9STRA|nr:hypothetical protein TeGR_g3289 [Tetraparma gracilis]